MEHKTLLDTYRNFVLKIKTHPIYAFVVFVLLLGFLIFTYAHPLNTHYENSAHASLPSTNQPAGTFTLITEPDQSITPVLNMIKNATSSIDLVMYEFKDKQIADALAVAQKRGVIVRVLLNEGYYGKEEAMNEPAYSYLESLEIPVHWTPEYFALTHQKTLIVDQNKALIMTFNLAPEYYATGRDFGILDIDQNDVRAIENTFENDWTHQNVLPSNGDDLVWSPGVDENMLVIINSAKKELDIYNEEMEDSVITDALMNAARRGVAVNIVMTYQSAAKLAFGQLKNAGVSLHLFHGEKFYIHAKMIIADDTNAFLGSENFSYTSLNKNRELGIFLSDPIIINSLVKTFYADFNNAKEY
ncbi:MAG: phospholipase D-like domain-containing protein [Candidatus Pacebacteria bacterium]|nr:phospholipase D-like domain-containing protein [Candidatus Paceibacterota bacterium]